MRINLRAAIAALLGRRDEATDKENAYNEAVARLYAERHDWQLNAYGGGGSIRMPHATRQEAMDAANKSGTVQHVDDVHHFVFYKPPGFNGGESALKFGEDKQ